MQYVIKIKPKKYVIYFISDIKSTVLSKTGL